MSNENADASIRRDFLRGVNEIRGVRPPITEERKELVGVLRRIVASLRRDRASSAASRQARSLAVRGFEATMKGTESQIDFVENDSGNIAAATRDARRADRNLRLGADRLRAAGRLLGIHIGRLNQY